MAHQLHPDLLHDAGFHHSRGEGVSQIMEADAAYAAVLERRPPGALHEVDRAAAEVDHESFRFAVIEEVFVQARGKRNLAGLPFGSFRVRDEERFLDEIDIFPALAGDLAPAHPSVERNDDHGAEVIRRDAEQSFLLGETQDLAAGAPLPRHLQSGKRILGDELLVKRPVEDPAQDAQVTIDRRVLDRRVCSVPCFPKILRERFRDSQRRNIREERQEKLQVVEVVGPDGATCDEPRGDCAEGYCGIRLDDLEAAVIEFLLELVFDSFRLLPI